jgi:hypothetical protein
MFLQVLTLFLNMFMLLRSKFEDQNAEQKNNRMEFIFTILRSTELKFFWHLTLFHSSIFKQIWRGSKSWAQNVGYLAKWIRKPSIRSGKLSNVGPAGSIGQKFCMTEWLGRWPFMLLASGDSITPGSKFLF